MFTPLFKWFTKRFNTGLSAACTLLSALAAVVVPVGALVGLAIVQIARMVDSVADWVRTTDLSTLGDKILQFVNACLTGCRSCTSRLPRTHCAKR